MREFHFTATLVMAEMLDVKLRKLKSDEIKWAERENREKLNEKGISDKKNVYWEPFTWWSF